MKPFIKNSVLAVNILSKSKQETYSQEVAKELGTTSSSVRRTVGDLYESSFLKKTKRKRAQHFKIDYSGIREYWMHQIKKSLEEISENEKFEMEEISISPETEEKKVKMEIEEDHYRIGSNPNKVREKLNQIPEENLNLFFKFYVSNYLDHQEESTMEKMLFQDLFQSLIRLDFELYPERDTSLPNDLKTIREALKLHIGVPSHLALKAKFEELLTEPELDEKDNFTDLLLQLNEEEHDTHGYTIENLEDYYFAREQDLR